MPRALQPKKISWNKSIVEYNISFLRTLGIRVSSNIG